MEYLVLSERERLKKAIMEMVLQKKLKLTGAAIQLDISYRQAKRIYRRYKRTGDAGLAHKGRGHESYRKHPHRTLIIARYKAQYEGFGPTLAAEKLSEEDRLQVDHETLRRWLLKEHLWTRQRKRSPYRSRRERREQFGELIQIDGSHHDWFEDDCQRCLINMVDDATGKTWARLEDGETTRGVFLLLRQWIKRYGIPLAIYVDLKNVYISPKKTGFSHVERACERLGIRIIKAYSPQAKGRVERNHAVYQDRFVKELRLKGIKTVEKANQLLEEGFVEHLNKKFEKVPYNPASAHRPLDKINLDEILCWEHERQLQHDWTFSFNNQIYQVKKLYGSHVRPKVNVHIRKHLDDTLSFWYMNEALTVKQLQNRQKTPVVQKAKIINIADERRRLLSRTKSWRNTMHELFQTPEDNKKY